MSYEDKPLSLPLSTPLSVVVQGLLDSYPNEADFRYGLQRMIAEGVARITFQEVDGFPCVYFHIEYPPLEP